MNMNLWRKVCSCASELYHLGCRGMKTLANGAKTVCRRIARQYEEDDPFIFFLKGALAGSFLGMILSLLFGEALFFLAFLVVAIAMGYAVPRVLKAFIESRRLASRTKSTLQQALIPFLS